MNGRSRLLVLPASLMALMVGAGAARAEAATPAQVVVKLIAFNDFHGNLNPPGMLTLPDPRDGRKRVSVPAGGAAYVASLVRELRARNPLSIVVAAGDLVGASPLVSALFHDEPTIEALNEIGLELSAVGNHEFDRGTAELLRLQSGGCGQPRDDRTCQGADGRFSGARFQYLAGNVYSSPTGKPVLPGSAVRELDLGGGQKLRLGFIGLVTRATPAIVLSTAVSDLDFRDEAESANGLAAELKAQGAHAIVVLIHEGVVTEGHFNGCPRPDGALLPILRQLDSAVDLVVSGHTHRAYICRTRLRDGRRSVLYTSAGSYGRFVTDIDLKFTRDGRLLASSASNIPVTHGSQSATDASTVRQLTAHEPVQQLVNRYNALAAPVERRVVGRISADITRETRCHGQSDLGRLIAESQRAATAAPERGAADLALMNPGGIRNDLAYAHSVRGEREGEVTYGEAFDALPMGNHLVTMTLTGAQIVQLLDAQWRGRARGLMLQASNGFRYRFRRHDAAGTRVVPGSVRLRDQPLETAKSYRVTVNNYLAAGGDGFSVLRQGTELHPGPPDVEAFVGYLASNNPAGAQRDPGVEEWCR